MDNRKTQANYYAKNSARNVVSHIRQWLYFSLYFGLPPLPAKEENLMAFSELMSHSASYEHIRSVISSIEFLHKNLSLNFPVDSFQLMITFQSLKRKLAKAPNQAMPITPEHLVKMYEFVDVDKPQELAVWCAILVGFFGFLRKKSICPENTLDIDPIQMLTVRKVKLLPEQNVALLYVNFSKTIQFGQRDYVIPILGSQCRALDAVYHLGLLFRRTEAPLDYPAFTYRTPGGSFSFVTHKLFTDRLKSLLSKAGFSPEKFSGHSLRRGAATFLFQCGASSLDIQVCGDWQSQVFTRYLQIDLGRRIQSQLLMAANLPRA